MVKIFLFSNRPLWAGFDGYPSCTLATITAAKPLSYWEVEKHSIQVNLTNWYARARFSAFNHQIEHRHPSQYLAPPIVAQTMMAVFGRADGQLLASSHSSLSPTPCRRPGPFYIAHLSSLMSYLFPLPHPCQGEEYDLPQLSLC
jgi:hypothetical protein